MIDLGVNHDDAAYLMPQGLRNVLIISATPYQWKHMIAQRVCRRNSSETRYVMLKIWDELYRASKSLFSLDQTGPFCMQGACKEGRMACGNPICTGLKPSEILKADFPNIYKGD